MVVKRKKTVPETEEKEILQVEEKAVIYIGPTIKGIVSANQVFLSLPQSLNEFKEKCPDIANLLVPVGEDYGAALKDLKITGSLTQYYYKNVLSYIQK